MGINFLKTNLGDSLMARQERQKTTRIRGWNFKPEIQSTNKISGAISMPIDRFHPNKVK